MSNQHISIATYNRADATFGASDIEAEETQELISLLQEKGYTVSLQYWDDDQVDWSKFDVIIVKSPWDYIYKLEAFRAWLDKLEGLKCRVLNPINILRWNSDKAYLRDMKQQGVTIIPTLFFGQKGTFSAKEVFEMLGVDKIVVKPRINGNGKDTFAVNKDNYAAEEAEINKLLQVKPLMIQPFKKEIHTKGEWAFLFFNGKFSHAALKHPKEGAFIVSTHDHVEEPPKELLAAAQDIVDNFTKGCLYTRVDGLEVDGVFTLMELEAVDPYLFLDGTAKVHKVNYYEALLALLKN